MKHWPKLRIILLAATFSGALLTLGKLILVPTGSDRKALTFDLPATVPLKDWAFVGSDPLRTQSAQSPGLLSSVDEQSIAAHHYQYAQKGVQLEIEMRYFSDSFIDVPSIVRESSLTARAPTIALHDQFKIGAYALFNQQGRTYLSACIRPSGQTTVSDRQFHQSQNSVEVLSERFLPWILGQASLRDLRCLWANLSIPSTASLETSEQILRNVWVNWQPWWKRHFPQVEKR